MAEETKPEKEEIIEIKVVFFKPVEKDPIYGVETPEDLFTETFSRWLVEGIEKNYTGPGYINVSNDWVNPFGSAFYCGRCGTVQRNDQRATDEDGLPIEYEKYYLCKTCLENIKNGDPTIYKDLMGLE